MNYSDKLSDNELTIFLLHGVINENKHHVRNYTKKHLHIDIFYNIINELCKNGVALSMDEVTHHVTVAKPLPKKSFAITFDDGFENNYSIASPVLEQLQVPATFYITTDFIDSNRMSWIDRIEYVVELSARGHIQFQSEIWTFNHEINSKINFLNQVRKKLKNEPTLNLDEIATDIQQQLGFEPIWSSEDPLDKKMNWQQVNELNQNSLFTIGGHTHTHPVLAHLNDDDSENEIKQSLHMIHKKIGLQCQHYSYPEGLTHCYSEREINTLKKHGIICCPSAEEGRNTIKSDLFHLKRIFVV